MNEQMRTIAAELRAKRSDAAADWLIQTYPAGSPSWGDALRLLEHVSLRKADLNRLADHYLRRRPFAQARPYAVFATLLGLQPLLSILSSRPPENAEDAALLLYHLQPLLDRAAGEDGDAVRAFRSRLEAIA